MKMGTYKYVGPIRLNGLRTMNYKLLKLCWYMILWYKMDMKCELKTMRKICCENLSWTVKKDEKWAI